MLFFPSFQYDLCSHCARTVNVNEKKEDFLHKKVHIECVPKRKNIGRLCSELVLPSSLSVCIFDSARVVREAIFHMFSAGLCARAPNQLMRIFSNFSYKILLKRRNWSEITHSSGCFCCGDCLML